jgi:hypothetical protein
LLDETKNDLPWRIARVQERKHLSLSKNKGIGGKNGHTAKLITIKCYQCGSTEYGDVTCHIREGEEEAPLIVNYE